MTLTFRVRFATWPGQSLWLTGAERIAGELPLQYRDPESWQLNLSLPAGAGKNSLNYSYILRDSNGARTTDWGRDRTLIPANYDCEDLLVIDSWNQAGYIENAFYTAPFKNVLLAPWSKTSCRGAEESASYPTGRAGDFTKVKTAAPENPTHTFRVRAPLLARGQTVCLLAPWDNDCYPTGRGESALGWWNTQSPVLLGRKPGEDYFSVQLDLRGQTFPFAYKYGVFDVEKNSFVRYEDGANRMLSDEIAPGKHTVIVDGFVRLPATGWRGAGVAVPVFSLRSENSFGVGEFADLKLLADWCKQAGLKLIQILPVNDTSATNTWRDSYPYAAISAFALHPIYLNLAAVANAKNRKLLVELEPERRRLNALDAVDYEAVMKAKLEFLRKIFPSQSAETFRSAEYRKFFAENKDWLAPYAAFCFLRHKFGTADFNRWQEHNTFDAKKISELAEGNNQIAFHSFVQFHLHRQLHDAAAHIRAAGLVLKGDLAIGVARNGADTWQQPELFHLDAHAGAPPDPFSATGQNWGFPTYNWPRMAADRFAWWKRRLAQMESYFDAFRIDHILGFFRIWSNPAHAVEGILGHFVPAIPVEPDEFAARGIPFDRERLTRPFITDAVLDEMFGSEANQIRSTFLQDDVNLTSGSTVQRFNGLTHYSLKPEFATQQLVENQFAALPSDTRNAKLKTGLFNLISNVILLEAEGKLHFRFFMEQTLSFRHLPSDTQTKLRQLYVDYFFRRQDDFWMREAMQKLPALKRVTNMLVCGEDLGLVPACVPDVMKDLGLLSLEIQRMPKTLGAEFSRPANAPYLSVVTPSTHDMSTIRGWWTEERALVQKFFSRELGWPGEAPAEAGNVEHFPVAGFARPGRQIAPRRRGRRTHQRAG
jgi:4-alpha-glucanotransferase